MNRITATGYKDISKRYFIYAFQELGDWYAVVHNAKGERLYKTGFYDSSLSARQEAMLFIDSEVTSE